MSGVRHLFFLIDFNNYQLWLHDKSRAGGQSDHSNKLFVCISLTLPRFQASIVSLEDTTTGWPAGGNDDTTTGLLSLPEPLYDFAKSRFPARARSSASFFDLKKQMKWSWVGFFFSLWEVTVRSEKHVVVGKHILRPLNLSYFSLLIYIILHSGAYVDIYKTHAAGAVCDPHFRPAASAAASDVHFKNGRRATL